MAPLKCAGVAVALLFSSPSRADPVAQWQPYIAEASTRFGLPALWIERVVRAESGGRTVRHGHPITSRAGAMGLMQLMPGTWAAIRARLDLGPNPHDPRDNILAGTYYLRLMYDRFGYPGLFAAYNAGPGRYSAYLEGRAQLPEETVAYMRTVTGVAMIEPRVPSPPSIFVPGTTFVNAGESAQSTPTVDPIFFIKKPKS